MLFNLDVVVLSVDDSKFSELQFLNPQIFRAKKVADYNLKSDYNNKVINSIWKNTRAIAAASTKPFVLVLQQDVKFTDAAVQVIEKLKLALTFLQNAPDADLFFLGYHPNAEHMKTKTAGVCRLLYSLHWQAVIFRRVVLLDMPEPPHGVHNDIFFQSLNEAGVVKFYGLSEPIAKQRSNRFFRYFEYELFYKVRASDPRGDPMYSWLVFALVTFLLLASL